MLQRVTSRKNRIFLGSLAITLLTGCGDDVTSTQTPLPPTGSFDSARPPEAPENAANPDGQGATFAISKFRLGVTDERGVKNTQAWKTIGYNLDDTLTTRTTAGVIIGDHVCAHVDGATFKNVEDGENGRDNGFGLSVLPVMQAVNADVELKTNDYIRFGKHTLLVDIIGLGEAPTYAGLTARIYSGQGFTDAQGMTAMPAFDGTDEWPIGGESVADGILEKPLVLTNDAYVADAGAGGTFVAQFDGPIVVMMDALGLPEDQGILPLRIHEPLISMRLSADRKTVESGTITGFIDTAEFDLEAARLVTIAVGNTCESPTALAIRHQLRQGSDILRGGVVNNAKACDSISIGIEFQATRAKLGTVVAPFSPLKNPCAK